MKKEEQTGGIKVGKLKVWSLRHTKEMFQLSAGSKELLTEEDAKALQRVFGEWIKRRMK